MGLEPVDSLREKWNRRYRQADPDFAPHSLAVQALAEGIPEGSVLELACGTSGSALMFAAQRRHVIAVDVSDVALDLLVREARRRGVERWIDPVCTDVAAFPIDASGFALVLTTLFWDPQVFTRAAGVVARGGMLGWEALTSPVSQARSSWYVDPAAVVTLLPAGFEILAREELSGPIHDSVRILARLSTSIHR